jgi:hypothetical protein
MKTLFVTFLFFGGHLCFSGTISIRNVHAIADTTRQLVTVTFDIDECRGHGIGIRFKISYGTNNYRDVTDEATGDVGEIVVAGPGKIITWSYANLKDSLLHRWHWDSLSVVINTNDLCGVDTEDMVQYVDFATVQNFLSTLIGNRCYKDSVGAVNIAITRERLVRDFEANRFKTCRQPFTFRGNYTGCNIIGFRKGAGDENKVVIVTAHYDTVLGTPGADDNASGVTALLEIARIFSLVQFKYSILLVAFDLEEAGLIGSNHFVRNYLQAYDTEVLGVINLDMIGFFSRKPNSQTVPAEFKEAFPDIAKRIKNNKNRADFALSIANHQSADLNRKFINAIVTFVPDLDLITYPVAGNGEDYSGSRESDHASFWDNGYAAISVGDGGGTRNRFYHTADDTYDKINIPQMIKVIKGVVAAVSTIAEPIGADFYAGVMIERNDRPVKTN